MVPGRGESRALLLLYFRSGHQRKLFLDHTERRHPDFWRLLFSTRQKSRLEEYLGHSLGRPIKTEACQAVRPRGFSDFITGRDGVYLIGEAAGFISASSFEGISSAIRSGSALAEAMSQAAEDRELARLYRRKMTSLRLKLWIKTIKRWFMYTPWVRHIIMRLGLAAIHVEQENK